MNASMKATTAGVLTTAPVTVTEFVWIGVGSIGDQLVVQDSAGHLIWQAVAQSAQYNLSFAFEAGLNTVNGINVITITSGTLIVRYV